MSSRYVQITHFAYSEKINNLVTNINYSLDDEMFSRDMRRRKFTIVQLS